MRMRAVAKGKSRGRREREKVGDVRIFFLYSVLTELVIGRGGRNTFCDGDVCAGPIGFRA